MKPAFKLPALARVAAAAQPPEPAADNGAAARSGSEEPAGSEGGNGSDGGNGLSKKQRKFGKFGKDPTVTTDFLPDK